jgi:tetratricopeptide (TPR) repeat protein
MPGITSRILQMTAWLLILTGGVSFADDRQRYFEQGEQAYQGGDYQRAAKLYEKVVEIDPNYAPAYNALGLTYKGLNAPLEDVTWLFKVATEIDPNYVEAYDNECKTYYQVQHYDDAEAACLKILSLVLNILSLLPQHGGAQFTLGWIYLARWSRTVRCAILKRC